MKNKKLPIGVMLIVLFYLFGACVLIVSMFTNYAEVAEQITLVHGLPLELKWIVLPVTAIFAIVIAYGLYSHSRWGYYLALIYEIYFGAVNLFLLKADPVQPFIGNFVWALIVVIYLIFRRRTFILPKVALQSAL